jgi:Xaa-Pro aminopeptidase
MKYGKKKEVHIMTKQKLWRFFAAWLFIFFLPFPKIFSQDYGVAAADDSYNILPERERARVMNEWLRWRLENILPPLMQKEGIDMWLVINREYNEDPVYMSLVPEPVMYARRTSILIFVDRGEKLGVERLSGSYYGMGEWYQSTWIDKKKRQFDSLAEFIRKRNPKKIGINISSKWAFGDGLSAHLKEKLEKALGPELSPRLVSAENICVGWLETRSPMELGVYRHICGIAHDIIADFFSNKVIIPDVTTTDDVVWWIRQRLRELGLDTWFQPSISIQRHKKIAAKYENDRKVIRRGDLLHCDVGIVYLGLCTDMQWQAYVCRIGEDGAPEGIKNALKRANRVAEIFMKEFQSGRTGKEITDSAMEKAEAEGLKPLIYSHPIGFHGHGAGCQMDARPLGRAPEGIERQMEYHLHYNTVYAIEFSSTTNVPEWDNQDVRIGFEENGVFTETGCHWVDGHQQKLYIIK